MPSRPSSTSISRRLAGIAVGAVCGLAALCLVLEAALRLAGYQNVQLYGFDPLIGTVGRANLDGVESTEGRARVHFNSLGMHDEEHAAQRAPGTFRLLVAGDSMTAATQVDISETYSSRLKPVLEQCPALRGRSVEVINIASDGFNLYQQYLALRAWIPVYKPDLILVTENITAAPVTLFPGKPQADHSPLVDFSTEPPRIDTSFNKDYARTRLSGSWKFFLAVSDHSRLLQFLLELRRHIRAQPGSESLANPSDMEGPEWQAAWTNVDAAFDGIARLALAQKVPGMLALASAPGQVDPTRPPDRKDYGQLEQCYRQIAGRMKWPLLTSAGPLQAYAREHRAYLHGFGDRPGQGHWNRTGHAVAAKVFGDQICRNLTVGGG